RSQPPGHAVGAVATAPCGASDCGQWDQRATGTRTELCDPRTALPAGRGLARGSVAPSGVVARAMATAVSCCTKAVSRKGAQAAERAGTTTGQTAQAQGGP